MNDENEDMMVENIDHEKRLLGDVNDDVVTVECMFKRGVCQVHKIKGKKSVHKTKKWGQVRSGYGWIYSQTVRYTCPVDSCHVHHVGKDNCCGSYQAYNFQL